MHEDAAAAALLLEGKTAARPATAALVALLTVVARLTARTSAPALLLLTRGSVIARARSCLPAACGVAMGGVSGFVGGLLLGVDVMTSDCSVGADALGLYFQ